MKLNSFSSTMLLLSAIAPAALAQSTPSNIVPSDAAPAAAPAAVPAPVAPARPAAARPMIELSFQDVEVGELLALIARQFDVQVVISGDVSGKLRSINLTNKTPEAAIGLVVSAANLKSRKLEDGTFLIGKNLPDDATPLTDVRVLNPLVEKKLPGSFDTPNFARNTLPSSGGGDELSNLPTNTDIPSLVGSANVARKGQHMIRIRNVPPKVMAYWLDPANNEVPIQLQVMAETQEEYGEQPIARDALSAADQAAGNGGNAPSFNGAASINPYTQQRNNPELRSNAQFGGGGGGTSIQRPEGVDRIVAIDAQNSLLVFGTDEGVRSLQEIINFLDRPLRQVEIEAQFVQLTTRDTNLFGIDFTANQNNIFGSGFSADQQSGLPPINFLTGGVSVGYAGPNFRAVLTALVSQNRAKIINAPRVTTINNLTASLSSVRRTPIVLSSSQENINGTIRITQRLLYISTTIGLTVTPTINADDTVTCVMQPIVSTQTPSLLPGFTSIPILDVQRVATIANVRDGDTLALGGLRRAATSRAGSRIPILGDLPLIGGLFRTRNNVGEDIELIIFLTARIVRRAGEDDAVAGT